MTDPVAATPASADIPPYVPSVDTPVSLGAVAGEVKDDAKTLTEEAKADAKQAFSDLVKFSRVPAEEIGKGIEAALHRLIDAL